MAAGVIQNVWIEGISNIAGAFTKRLSEARKSKLYQDWTYWNCITSQGDQVNMVMGS